MPVWLFLLALVFSIVPLVNILCIVLRHGVNNVTNDTLLVVPWLDRMYHGSYEWSDFLQETFINGHFQVFTLAIHLLVAIYFHFDIFILLVLGLAFAALRVVFLWKVFALQNPYLRCVFLIALSAATFSTSQISTFEFEWNTVMVNLSFLGFSIGLFGLVKFPDSWRGVLTMAIGGLLAGWTSASGVMAWASFLLGMALLGYTKGKFYLFWIASGVVVFFPYLLYLFAEPSRNPYSTIVGQLDFLRLKFVISGIGYPMSQGFLECTNLMRGVAGLALLLPVLAFLFANKNVRCLLVQSAPAVMSVSFSLLTLWQISVFREDLVPFYTAYSMFFWLGLFGIALVILDRCSCASVQPIRWKYAGVFSSLLVCVSICYFYFSSNLTFEDKSATLKTRSSASASCLRHYRTAPTYCESTILNWYLLGFDEFRKMSAQLEKNRWSVFAPRQEWYLQGDFLLDNVSTTLSPGAFPVFWTKGMGIQPVPATDYRRLNLFLQSPNALEWTVSLPKALKLARLRTAVAVSDQAATVEGADGMILEILAIRSQGKSIPLFQRFLAPNETGWKSVEISLDRFAGAELTLRFSVISVGNNQGDWGVFRSPWIEIDTDSGGTEEVETSRVFRPSNTELSAAKKQLGDSDHIFEVGDLTAWSAVRMLPVDEVDSFANIWSVENDPFIEYKKELSIQLSDYSHWYVKLAASPGWKNRLMQIYYRLEEQESFEEVHSVKIPLINDGLPHEYTCKISTYRSHPISTMGST